MQVISTVYQFNQKYVVCAKYAVCAKQTDLSGVDFLQLHIT